MKYFAASIILYLGTTAFSQETDESTANNLTVPYTVYSDLKREVEMLQAESNRQSQTIKDLKLNYRKLITIERQYEDLQRNCEEANRERGTLRKSLASTELYLYQLEWKVIVQQAIVYYERQFDQLEIRHVKSTFQLNHTCLDDVEYDDDYDRLAELRRQRWVFYLNEPPGAFWYFNDLVIRVEKSNHTKEEFARNIAILYRQLTQSIYKEAMEIDKHIVRSVSDYKNANSIIPLLVAQYTKTKPIVRLLEESTTTPSTPSIMRLLDELRTSTTLNPAQNSTNGCVGCT